jgi:GT2 family glycosyltransferase
VNPPASIVIVTYNSAPYLADCLESIKTLRYEPAPQVVVVDNASGDESVACVRERLPEALVLPQAANLGFAGGVNAGVAASTGEIIALLNPDAVVDPGWLAELVAALDDPACGIAGSKILDYTGQTLLHAGGEVSRATLITSHRGEGRADRGQYATGEAVPFLTGAALALRRSVWDRLGGLDAGFYPAYFEDLDLCFRTRALGLACHYAPRSVVRHAESASTGKYSGAFYYYYHRNRLRFACKHLTWAELWGEFCPAEAARMGTAPPLDRLVAALAYREALPHGLAPPDAAEQARVLARGRILTAAHQRDTPAAWPAEVQALLGVRARQQALLAVLLDEVRREAVLREHEFRSALPLVAALRRRWNSVATRWYVLPMLHQQTRANLALQRGLEQLAELLTTDSAALGQSVYQAALCFRMAEVRDW